MKIVLFEVTSLKIRPLATARITARKIYPFPTPYTHTHRRMCLYVFTSVFIFYITEFFDQAPSFFFGV